MIRIPAGSVEPGPVSQVLGKVLHADDAVLHRPPSVRRGRYRHQGVVVQLKRGEEPGRKRKARNGRRRMNTCATTCRPPTNGWRRPHLLPLFQATIYNPSLAANLVQKLTPRKSIVGQTSGACSKSHDQNVQRSSVLQDKEYCRMPRTPLERNLLYRAHPPLPRSLVGVERLRPRPAAEPVPSSHLCFCKPKHSREKNSHVIKARAGDTPNF